MARELAPAGLRSGPFCECCALRREQAPSPQKNRPHRLLGLTCGPCGIGGRCLRGDGRGACAGAREEGLPGVAQARGRGGVGGGCWRIEGGEGLAAGQRRAIEQQTAIATFFPERVMRGGGWAVLDGGLRAMVGVFHRRHVHAQVHRHVHGHRGRALIHRHRLGNQRADKDHQHGEQADPAAARQSRRLTTVCGWPGARRAHGAFCSVDYWA